MDNVIISVNDIQTRRGDEIIHEHQGKLVFRTFRISPKAEEAKF